MATQAQRKSLAKRRRRKEISPLRRRPIPHRRSSGLSFYALRFRALDGRRLLKKAGENFPEDTAVGFVINLNAALGRHFAFCDYLFSLFSHCWLAIPQLVLQADWQDVWHSPQPPFFALSQRLRVSRVLICFIIDLQKNHIIDYIIITKKCQEFLESFQKNLNFSAIFLKHSEKFLQRYVKYDILYI